MTRVRPAALVAAALLVGAACGGTDPSSGASGARAGPGSPATDTDAPLIATADDRGSFSVPCPYSHTAGDDPIVHPGHAGLSHRHDFFGATTTDAGSTAGSLLAGGTTCRSVADRSAYWSPQLRAGDTPVAPTEVVAYYRTPVGVDARAVEPLPNGLEMVAGDPYTEAAQDPAVVHWSCGKSGAPSPVPVRCPAPGASLGLWLTFAPCWDGTNLGSADHYSHLALVGAGGCPESHPVVLPEVQVEVRYPTIPPGDLSLASGPLTGGHGDVLVAWAGDHMPSETAICLRTNTRCDVS